MFNTIKSNASNLAEADQKAYFTLVHLNIQSLMQVLTSVDANLMLELGTTQDLDDDTITGQITNTGTTTNTGSTGTGTTGTGTTGTGVVITNSGSAQCAKTLLYKSIEICDT